MQTLRHAARTFLRQPAFAGAAVVVLALGIGASTAIFTVVDAVLLRPLPFADPDRLVALLSTTNGNRTSATNPLDVGDWIGRTGVFEEGALYGSAPATMSDDQGAAPIAAFRASASLFRVLHVAPAIGRTFAPSDDRAGGEPVIVLSDALWRRLGRDPSLVGKTLRVNGEPRVVIGVLPPDANYPEQAEAWLPLALTPDELRPANRAARYLAAIARLKPGVSTAQASHALTRTAARLAQEYPDTNADTGAVAVPLDERLVASVRTALLVLLGAVGLLLLTACANVSNLLLAQASTRSREMAIRAALGAGRWAIARQLSAECLVLGGAAAAAGLLLGAWSLRALLAVVPQDLPHARLIAIDGRALFVAVSASLVVSVVCGIAPMRHAMKTDLVESLRAGRQDGAIVAGSGRARRGFIVAEVALSLVLLVGAGMSARAFAALVRTNPGFTADGVLSARLVLPPARYATPERVVGAFARLVERVRAQPGVTSAAAVSMAPLEPRTFSGGFVIEGQPAPAPGREPDTSVRAVTGDYFSTMRIPIVRGRAISDRDTATAPPVVLVSETTARTFWRGADPIGSRVRVLVNVVDGPPAVREVVGIVRDVSLTRLDEAPGAVLYVPHAQYPASTMTIVARTAAPEALAPALRHELARLDPDLAFTEMRPMVSRVARSSAERRFQALLLGLFAAAALILAMTGLSAVMTFSVNQRSHEIGVRMALGAAPSQVMGLIFTEGMLPVLIGIGVGFGMSAALSRAASGLVFSLGPLDVVTFAVVAAALVAAALLACYFPARRALAVDPIVALRSW